MIRRLALTPILFLFALLLMGASDPDPAQTFGLANKFYAQAQYDSAIGLYQQLVDQGWQSADLYLNLGNSYYQQGTFGKALWSYERGLRLAPRDEGLRANRAETLRQLQLPELSLSSRYFSLSEQYQIALALWLVCLLLVFLLLRTRLPYLRPVLFAFTALFLLVGGNIIYQWYQQANHRPALVVVQDAPLYPVPTLAVESSGKLRAGWAVTLIEERPDWAKISYNGVESWVGTESILALGP